MNKIINGKRYSTESAKWIGSVDYGTPGDFSHYSDNLYRKKTGEFFLYGEGGPMSIYAESTGENEWSGGEAITPLSYEEAQVWAEENLDGEKYEEIFGLPEEDTGDRQTVSLRLSQAAIQKMKKEATVQGIPMSEYVERLILK